MTVQPQLLLDRRFRAMNTDVRLVTPDPGLATQLAAAERIFHAAEARFSRFLPASELSELNRSQGEPVRVSQPMLELLALALEMNQTSGGIFDPAILPSLEAAGYDRSFDLLDSDAAPVAQPPVSCSGSIRSIRIDRQNGTVTLPAGLRLDFGGIGKGYAVDLAGKSLGAARSFLIDAGGDILAHGSGPDGDGWCIGVASPLEDAEDLDLIILRDQAVATSSVARRRWTRGGREQNHLIDPRTGSSVSNGILSVSAIAEDAVKADVFAKTALILGYEDGSAFLESRGSAGLFVDDSGGYRKSPGWSRVSWGGS